MSEYTPTVAFAEREYVTGRIRRADCKATEARAEFNRMIAKVERVAAARALEEAADEIYVKPEGWRIGGESAAFHEGADLVYAALRARAAEIQEGVTHDQDAR